MEALMGYEDVSDGEQKAVEEVESGSAEIVTIVKPAITPIATPITIDSAPKSKKEVLFTVVSGSDTTVAETTADELSSVSGSAASLPFVCCEVCQEHEKRYKCPRCAIVTCSLDCVKKHKLEAGCSGVRDKTQYVPIKSFSNRELRSDFHFLEDVLQKRDSAQRTYVHDTAGNRGTKVPKSNPHKKRGRSNAFNSLAQFNTSYQNLENYSKGVKNIFHAAKDRGIKLLLMPPGMSKRNYNTSYVDHKSKTLKWRVNVAIVLNEHFSVADVLPYETHCCGRTTQDKHQYHEHDDIHIAATSDHFVYSLHASIVGVTLESVNENDSIQSVLQSIFDTAQAGSKLKHLLKPFQDKLSSFTCLMKKIPSPANDPLYCKLLLDQTLKEALLGQTILEYPTLYFCPEEAAKMFPLMIAELPAAAGDATQEPKKHLSKQERFNNRKKRGIEEVVESGAAEQQLAKKSNSAGGTKAGLVQEVAEEEAVPENEEDSDNEEEEGDEETDSEDEEGYDEFMKALVDLQDADTSVLQQFIKQAEEQLKHKE